MNAVFPTRDRTSDGWIGDAAHQSRRTSDHNPWKIYQKFGVVRARDFDKDHLPADEVVGFLVTLGRKGFKPLQNGGYVIWNGVIYSSVRKFAPKKYTGPNSHAAHFHVSVGLTAAEFDFTGSWGLAKRFTPAPPPATFSKVIIPSTITEDTVHVITKNPNGPGEYITDGMTKWPVPDQAIKAPHEKVFGLTRYDLSAAHFNAIPEVKR